MLDLPFESDPPPARILPRILRGLLFASLVALTLASCAEPPLPLPRVSCTYVRVDERDAELPSRFVNRLKQAIAKELTSSGSMPPGFPIPCRWENATGRVSYCLPDASATLESTDAFLIHENGTTLTFRVIDFPSPMPFAVDIYLLPRGAVRQLRARDRDARFRRVQILGGHCDEPIHRAVLAAGAVSLDE